MFPTRVSLLTYNLWNTQRWPAREPALRAFFQRFRPDIFGLQELRAETRAALDQALPDYQRVDDPFPGWTVESNLFWNGDLFEEVSHGITDIDITSDQYRGLFWVRLRVLSTGQTLFVSTAHFTHQEHPDEVRTGLSPRLAQAQSTVSALERLVQSGEAGFFMGDLNDPVIPTFKLAEAGYLTCFARLGLVPPPTWPSIPTADHDHWNRITTQSIDWIVSNNLARPIFAGVPHFYHGGYSPSDHWPVLALYEIER